MLVLAPAKMTDPKAVDLLMELLQEDQIAGHAVRTLAILRAPVGPELIRPFTKHSYKWVRRDAERVLANSWARRD